MSLARFFPRIHDAIGPLLTVKDDLRSFLGNKIVTLEAPHQIEQEPVHLAGFALAINLCARLYPRLALIGPERVVEHGAHLARRINPRCDIQGKATRSDGHLAWALPHAADNVVSVSPVGWTVAVDSSYGCVATNLVTSLAAACIGVGELFRSVFDPFLPNGRKGPCPGTLNVVTLGEGPIDLPPLPDVVQIGRVHLVGAGAIGQAVAYSLARLSVQGELLVSDPERIELSNLQRYVLAEDEDVGGVKCRLIARALQGSLMPVVCNDAAWNIATREADLADTILTAVDSVETRIAVQAGLPRRIYNAWTQPRDIGWSRHERFGIEPCLACLYWPTGPRPSEHELIARTLRQHPLRVLAHLTRRIPVDVPLQPEQIPRLPQLPLPPEAHSWTERAILHDVANDLGVSEDNAAQWKGKTLSDLYRDGICGGALLTQQAGEITAEMTVPLAHQSALAGVMLVAQLLIAMTPDLAAFRPDEVEGRLDVLAGLQQIVKRPRRQTNGCICSDSDFLERFRAKWPS